ncbi:MAG: DUF4350 domain-containing protein [Treponema sp.]|nr:DUF4350 domain-containing protein [Treponema sp.]
MKKNVVVFFVVLAVLTLIGVFCYTYLEIVDTTRWEGPSREARENPYLALERWLSVKGIPIRTLSDGTVDTVLEGPEKTVFIAASCFDWADESEEDFRLTPWVKAGGRLIISIDTYNAGWWLSKYLETLGVAEYEENYDDEDIDENTGEDEEAAGELFDRHDDTFPSLDHDAEFVVTGKSEDVDRISIVRSYRYRSGNFYFTAGKALLVHLEMGAGSITVTGDAYFLRNAALRKASNANLAGVLFTEKPPENGVLFISEGQNEKHLFGSLAETGNVLAILVSAITLIVIGFWMVIPLFGRTRPVSALPGKPLRERFLAEGRFLFAYNGLDRYFSAYRAELEQRRRIRGIETEKKPEAAANKLTLRQFMKRQRQYTEELEKLDNGNF